jgi:2-keto-4-pentenoate hydratase/2-oxohepta-3-ene-1,7-dioic acid hydratase in catechol pathway
VENGSLHDVTDVTEDLPSLRWPLPMGDQLIANLSELRGRMVELAAAAPAIELDTVRLLSPVANPGKLVCGAGNWQHHNAPLGMIGMMFKASSALVGAGEGLHIRWPDRTTLHEPELAVVIGRECSNVSEYEALDYVAGYSCAFDTTLKAVREDPAFCKSFDTYGTLGPWLVTADEIVDPSALSYRFWIDDDLRGERNFSNLTGTPAQLIAFASSAMTLYPGDVVLSGAADVGPVHPGETMTMEIPEIGKMSVAVVLSEQARAAPAQVRVTADGTASVPANMSA